MPVYALALWNTPALQEHGAGRCRWRCEHDQSACFSWPMDGGNASASFRPEGDRRGLKANRTCDYQAHTLVWASPKA